MAKKIENVTFVELAKKVEDEAVKTRAAQLVANVDERAARETAKKADNDKIQNTLRVLRGKVGRSSFARFAITANVPENFILRSVRSTEMFNVYAVGKLVNLSDMVMLGSEAGWNEINRAIVASLFKCEKAGVEFSHKMAIAATSRQIAIDANLSKHLVRYTVSPSTSTTQASSTMQALATCGVVSKYENEAGADCYRLTETPLTAAFREMFA